MDDGATGTGNRASQHVFHAFAGTRPEVVKLGPVVHALRDVGAQVVVVATGQQNDPALIDATFAAANLKPDVTWDLGDGSYFDKAGALYAAALTHLSEAGPNAVAIVQGDTTTVPIVAHAARRNMVPVVHVEAGLRSLNPQSLEETNRKVAAAISAIHFAPTELAARFLAAEGVPSERVFVVGNSACDALLASGVQSTPVAERVGVVVTAHRATNVDDPTRLRAIVDIVMELARTAGPVVFPLHPRTRGRLDEFEMYDELLATPGLNLCDPMPYGQMLGELATCRLVVTDSGGLQEEAAWFGVPTVVMRSSTPRWEGVENGTAILAGVSYQKVMAAAAKLLTAESQEHAASVPCPYGVGDSGQQMAQILISPLADELLQISEPDYTDGSLPAVVTASLR